MSGSGTLRVTPDAVARLQHFPTLIRNISIIAHVDHGKTSLSDCLIAASGLFSAKQAGKLRYLDDTPEEQRRGITMKSSAIALLHRDRRYRDALAESKDTEQQVDYLINLIDSPGHVDFSADVASAVRLCDGALVIIDAVEGVRVQTHAVLRQAWEEGVKTVLVINKVDRLMIERQLTPEEAFQRLWQIVEQVNVITSSFMTAEWMGKDEEQTETEQESNERRLLFSPAKGNVVFASAIDGWAFSVDNFAELLEPRLEIPRATLRKALWGDYYYKPKSKTIVAGDQGSKHGLLPMFAQYVLDTIWKVYDCVLVNPDAKRMEKVIDFLKLGIPARDLRSKDDRAKLQAVMRSWLPLPRAVLGMVVRALPSPKEAAPARIQRIWKSPAISCPPDIRAQLEALHTAMLACDTSDDVDTVAYVAKVVSVPTDVVSACEGEPPRDFLAASPEASEPEMLVGFVRVFCGTFKPDRKIFVLGPKYDPVTSTRSQHLAEIDPPLACFSMMGRHLMSLPSIPAGNVAAVAGLRNHVLKTATLCTTKNCNSLLPMSFQSTPLVRVSVEPKVPSDLPALRRGLQRLNQADPCVQVVTSASGELQLCALGELHLERCLQELQERFAKVPVQASEPILLFQETIVKAAEPDATALVSPTAQDAKGDESEEDDDTELIVHGDEEDGESAAGTNADGSVAGDAAHSRVTGDTRSTKPTEGVAQLEKRVRFDPVTGLVTAKTQDGLLSFTVSARPLPEPITRLLESSAEQLQLLFLQSEEASNAGNVSAAGDGETARARAASTDNEAEHKLAQDLQKELHEAGKHWQDELNKIWSFGPKRCGPNILVSHVHDGTVPDRVLWHGNAPSTDWSTIKPGVLTALQSLYESFVGGFQIATSAGPMCGEPMWGVCFTLEHIDVIGDTDAADESTLTALRQRIRGYAGQVMSLMGQACRRAFLAGSQRLVEALYRVELQCAGSEHQGKVYGVLSRRRGEVLNHQLLEGTQVFVFSALLPVVESFGFATDLRTKTSGTATQPQLVFSHWQILDIDPYFKPKTEEEREEFGEEVYDATKDTNVALRYIRQVRAHKGLAVERKIVVSAEKQRNLSRKK